jgi:hypothetical protein
MWRYTGFAPDGFAADGIANATSCRGRVVLIGRGCVALFHGRML